MKDVKAMDCITELTCRFFRKCVSAKVCLGHRHIVPGLLTVAAEV